MRRVRLFAVAAASTTLVWNHRGRAPGKNLDILDSVENVNVQASTAEPWEGMNANPFGTRPGFNRRTSFAGSVASTESTMSIMAYVKSLQARIWLSSERGLFYAGSPRRASVEESINPDAMGRFGIDSFIQEQDRELDTAIKHEIERDIGEMTYANDNEFILTDFKEVHQEFTKELEALDFGSTNLGAVLYHKTTALFKSLAPLIARSHRLKTSSRILLEDLGRLHLWEATFEEGQLNAILAESEAIQATVVDLISALIRVLVECKQANKTIPNLTNFLQMCCRLLAKLAPT